jgi:hypothetical protein
MTGESVEIEIDIVKKISSSGKAMLVTLTENGKDVWIPIAVIDYDAGCTITDEGDTGVLIISKWFAKREGLIKDGDDEE